jgi:YidC/Oxa1 family membrane protein insertase
MQQSGAPETRNLIIAIALSVAVMLGWSYFYERPRQAELQAEQARVEAQRQPQPPTCPAAQEGQASKHAPQARRNLRRSQW